MLGRGILLLSAVILFLLGGAGLFAAPEMAAWLGAPGTGPTAVILQIAASATLGLAALNWLSRKNRIGGIYSRPLCLANLLFFTSAALCVGKPLTARQLPETWLVFLVLSSGLALAFVWLMFFHDPVAQPAARS